MRAFNVDRELGNATVISWNHREFEVRAPSGRNSMTSCFFLFRSGSNRWFHSLTRVFLQVKYECLSDEIKIGDYYLRLLLEEDENEESSAIKRS